MCKFNSCEYKLSISRCKIYTDINIITQIDKYNKTEKQSAI